MGLCGRHGRLLNICRVGGVDRGGGLGVWSSAVWRTKLICRRHKGNVIRKEGIAPKTA